MRLYALALAAMALAGCRDILGIEELGLVDGAAEGDAARRDASGRDGSSEDVRDAGQPVDAAADAPAGDDCGAQSGLACTQCCRSATMMQYGTLQMVAQKSGCFCVGGVCDTADACATSLCEMTDARPPPPTMGCAACVDEQFLLGSEACMSAIATCLGAMSAECGNAAGCLESCK